MKVSTFSAAAATLVYALSAVAAPADVPVTIIKVGDKPDIEQFAKRDAMPEPQTTRRLTWQEAQAALRSASRAATTPVVVDGSAVATQSGQLPTTAAPSTAPASTAGADIRDAVLNEHNTFRAQHGAAPLSWSPTLAEAALKWGSRCVFQHSQGAVGPYGENLAASAGSGVTINTALQGIRAWEAEAPEYDPNNPVYSHFTQRSIFPAQYGVNSYLVCEYNPPGNVYPASNFRANVQP
ncbi:hypothetical protein Rhopal_006441-T1 [Rhodotorula paludigena]|uniref:SCP domain-containing protein n=1 Tax=Rhodotorula paludigena TaxID=86838 RepID=A0AAV5GVL1_9BASI|nr:hypothetical protein Rhopal_006441-T1 [Rhodotorula paludigena]